MHEEEELQLALAISQSEAEARDGGTKHTRMQTNAPGMDPLWHGAAAVVPLDGERIFISKWWNLL